MSKLVLSMFISRDGCIEKRGLRTMNRLPETIFPTTLDGDPVGTAGW